MIKTAHHSIVKLLFLIGSWFICGCTSTSEVTPTVSKQVSVEAVANTQVTNLGLKIPLTTGLESLPQHTYLSVSTSLGATLLTPVGSKKDYYFYLPPDFSKRAGLVNYCLIVDGNTIEKNSFVLEPELSQLGSVETYAGPRSIMANTRDFTMLVSIPTDPYDNLLTDGIPITLLSQFKDKVVQTKKELELGFAWVRVPAPLETGRISTASTINNIASEELAIDVFSDLAQDFSIDVSRNHTYADGNQICTFSTSQIKDQYNNVIPDGTVVDFFVKDDLGRHWKLSATTVNGYAFAKALHPEIPSIWKVQATMLGIAKSQQTVVTFDAILDRLPVTLEDNKVVVGPLHSYMGQLVEDGLRVDLIFGDQIETALTRNGRVIFELDTPAKRDQSHQMEVRALGLKQRITPARDEKK